MKSSNPTSNDSKHLIEQKIEGTELYKGKSFSFFSDNVLLPNGKKAKKDYVKYPHAVAVVPFVDQKTIILVKQFRYPVGEVLYEIPAGKMDDPEETKLEAAQRELLEETGYRAKNFDFLFSYYPCAGYSTEMLHIFRAAELKEESQYLDEDEFIDPVFVKFSEAIKMIHEGKIRDSKTILSLLYVQSMK